MSWDDFFSSQAPPTPSVPGSGYDLFFKPPPPPRSFGENVSRLGRNLVTGVGGLGQTMLSMAEMGADVTPAGFLTEKLFPEQHQAALEALRQKKAEVGAATAAIRPPRKEFLEDIKERPLMALAERGVESAPTTTMAMGAGLATGGGSLPAMVGVGLFEGAPAYSEARDRGIGKVGAATGAAVQGTVNAILERVGAQAILGRLGLKSGLPKLIDALAGEGTTEGAQQATDLLRRLSQGEEITAHQALNEIAEATAVGVATAGVLHPAFSGTTVEESDDAPTRRYYAPPQEPAGMQLPLNVPISPRGPSKGGLADYLLDEKAEPPGEPPAPPAEAIRELKPRPNPALLEAISDLPLEEQQARVAEFEQELASAVDEEHAAAIRERSSDEAWNERRARERGEFPPELTLEEKADIAEAKADEAYRRQWENDPYARRYQPEPELEEAPVEAPRVGQSLADALSDLEPQEQEQRFQELEAELEGAVDPDHAAAIRESFSDQAWNERRAREHPERRWIPSQHGPAGQSLADALSDLEPQEQERRINLTEQELDRAVDEEHAQAIRSSIADRAWNERRARDRGQAPAELTMEEQADITEARADEAANAQRAGEWRWKGRDQVLDPTEQLRRQDQANGEGWRKRVAPFQPEEIEEWPDLSPEHREVERGFARRIAEDPEGMKQQYRDLKNAEGKNETKGGKVINTDLARDLDPNYNASLDARSTLSTAVHEPASHLVKMVWEENLQKPPNEGEVMAVLFTAGGTGAGKSTGLGLPSMAPLEATSKIVYDTNMQSAKSAIKKIDQALDTGHDARIVYTWRNPVEAYINGTVPRAIRQGRGVHIDIHLATYQGSLAAYKEVRNVYADDPRVTFTTIDNSNGKGRVQVVDVAALDDIELDTEELAYEIAQRVQAEYQAGNIPERVYRGSGAAEILERRRAGSLEQEGGRDSQADGRGVQPQEPGRDTTEGDVTPPGAAPSAAPNLSYGKEATVHAPGIGAVKTRYALVEAHDLRTSHTDELAPAGNYPAELQNRDRTRVASAEQVRRIEQDPIPELLGENPLASDGAPVVGEDLVVESGNGRVIGMRRATRTNPEGFEAYRAFLLENAEKFGIDPTQVEQMQSPMLVRVRQTQVDREAFARSANVRNQAALSPGEVALDDARRMPLELLDYLDANSVGDLNSAGNRGFVRAFVQRVVPESEAGTVADSRGQLSKTGVQRLQGAIFAKAYDDPELVNRTLEETDDNAKRVGSGMVTVAPAWAKMRARMSAGELQQLDITSDLAAAVGKLSELRRNGPSVPDYLKQSGMFGEELTPEAREILRILDGPTGRAAKRVGNFLTRYTELVEGQGDPRQATLMAAETSSKMDLIQQAEQTQDRAGVPQESMFGSLGAQLFGPLFGGQRGGLAAQGQTQAIRPEIEKRWAAARGLPLENGLRRFGEALKGLWRNFRQAFPSLDTKNNPVHAQVNDSLRRLNASVHTATMRALDDIDTVTRDLSPEQGDLLTRLLALPDMIRSAEQGLYQDKELPFGYESVAEMQADLGRFEALASRPENAAVLKARAERTAIVRRVVGELVAADLVPAEYLDNAEAYFHRQVLGYYEKRERIAGSSPHLYRKGFQRKRTGGGDFNTSYHQAEFEWLRDAYELIAKKRAIQEIEKHDIAPELRRRAQDELGDWRRWRELIPEGYEAWQPEPGTRFYPTLTVTEKALDKMLAGETLTKDDLGRALAVSGPKRQLVLETGIVEALEQESALHEVNIADHIWRSGQTNWKRWTLISPLRLLKYNLNNMSGDLDIAIAVDPLILKHFPRAFNQLWQYQMKRNAAPALRERLLRAQELGVIDSGLTIEEIADVSRPEVLRLMSETDNRRLANLVPRYFHGARNFTVFRENLLRLAAWERALVLVKKSRKGGPRPYWASSKSEVDALYDGGSSDEVIAAKVAREAIGDYGNVSRAGQFIRARLMPFYSWLEVNAPRYVRLWRNEALADRKGKTAAKFAGIAAKKAVLGTAKWGTRAAFLYGAINLWNHLMFPEEERRMRKSRRELHLIYAKDEKTGDVKSIRFSGALSDALQWFGAEDLVTDVQEVAEGKATVADKLADAAKAPVERIVQGWDPFSKTGMELVTGRSSYPHVFEEGATAGFAPRTIYDRGGHLARTLSVGPLYDAATGKPKRNGSTGEALLQAAIPAYRTNLDESAYWESRRLQAKFLKERGKGISGGFDKNEKQLALYYAKKAAQYGDKEAQIRWLKKFRDLGGTARALEQSIQMSAPLGGMSKEDRAAFVRSLNAEERETLRIANRWYYRTMMGGGQSR